MDSHTRKTLPFFALLLLLYAVTFPYQTFAADLVLHGVSGSINTQVSFVLIAYNVPNEVEAFGLDIVFDPNILEYIGGEKGDLIKGFVLFDINPTTNGLKIGAATPNEKIGAGASGIIVTITFSVKMTYQESDINLNNLTDDIKNWSTETDFSPSIALIQNSGSGCFVKCLY